MKVLFVSSGNNKAGISPIVKAQGASLVKNESKIDLDYFTVVGKGLKGYIKNIFILRKYLKTHNYDIVHSHFFLSSIVAALANPKKIVVSLMGSDAYTSPLWNFLIRHFSKRWDAVIVKSERMKQELKIDAELIPNGVDTIVFVPTDKLLARKELGWKQEGVYILFASHPGRPEKNYELAEKAVLGINKEVDLITLKDVPHSKISVYLNAADLLLMTSKYEGSPNIIKEAMACNCPIVSTDVGDVKWVIGNVEGCFLVSEKLNEKRETINAELVKETSNKLRHNSLKNDKSKSRSADILAVTSGIREALKFAEQSGRTKGRERIIELGLDSETVAKKIIAVYKRVLSD